MKIYIALLRGINVGGKRIIRMEDLRALVEKLGGKDVTTYIQSGNVVFRHREADPKKLEAALSGRILSEFGFVVPAMILCQEDVQQILENNPFASDPSFTAEYLHVTILGGPSGVPDGDSLLSSAAPGESFRIAERAVYLFCPGGYSNSKLTNPVIEKKLNVNATTRNWRTLNELLILTKRIR